MFGGRKLKIFLVALAAVIVTLLSQESFAYYTTVGTATNVVTSGKIQMLIHERTDTGAAFPTSGMYVTPGDVISKQVTIENICTHPFYLRVKVVYGVDSQELSAEDCFKLNIDPAKWYLHTDGWYYYTGIVEPGETTPYVFSHVEIVGSKVDNRYLGKTLKLTVLAQAVQSEHNPIEDGNTYTASGWPAE